ncbi:MAG: TRAP transporter substrate-binding protein [Hyphomicrobiales bacterium]|nr:TRAP transporter substrate-binding protein [Hyphomicrobiales bacterium]
MTQAKLTTRRGALGAFGLAAGATLARPAVAKGLVEWRMATSWPKNLPGPGVSAERLARSIERLSDGRLTIKLYAAGELVPALEVFDAVAGGSAEMGHTASLYWVGKMPAAPVFTSLPFGLTPLEHLSWLEQGGGQALWDELYAPHGVTPFVAGNTGVSMAGWFRRELAGLDDVKGLKIRIVGLGAEIWRRMGATPVTLAPGEVYSAFQAGVVDAAELLAPASDLAVGLHRLTRHYYGPGFDKPNGAGEAIVSTKALQALPADLAAIVAAAARQEHASALAQAEWANAVALEAMVATHGVEAKTIPAAIVTAARGHGEDLLAELAGRDEISARIVSSYRTARARSQSWTKTNWAPFFAARS